MAEVQTEINTDWGISATRSTSHSFFGVSVSSYLTTSYGEKFSKVERSSQKVTVGISVDAKEDDRIYATVLDYDVWEYPVYGGHVFKGNVLDEIHETNNKGWTIPGKTTTGTEDDSPHMSSHQFSVEQNYPNPFYSSTNIRFTLAKPGNVRIDINNIQGQNVCTILDENLDAGEHEVNFDGSSLTSGLYFYKVNTGEFQSVKKMMLLK